MADEGFAHEDAFADQGISVEAMVPKDDIVYNLPKLGWHEIPVDLVNNAIQQDPGKLIGLETPSQCSS